MLLIGARVMLASGNPADALVQLDAAEPQLRDWEQDTQDDSQRQDAQVARALRAQALAMLGNCEPALALVGEQPAALLLNRKEIRQRAVMAVIHRCRPDSILSPTP